MSGSYRLSAIIVRGNEASRDNRAVKCNQDRQVKRIEKHQGAAKNERSVARANEISAWPRAFYAVVTRKLVAANYVLTFLTDNLYQRRCLTGAPVLLPVRRTLSRKQFPPTCQPAFNSSLTIRTILCDIIARVLSLDTWRSSTLPLIYS